MLYCDTAGSGGWDCGRAWGLPPTVSSNVCHTVPEIRVVVQRTQHPCARHNTGYGLSNTRHIPLP